MEAVVIGFIWVSFILIYGTLIWATVDMTRARNRYQSARNDMQKAEKGFKEARKNYEKAKAELNKPATVDTICYNCCGSPVSKGHEESCIYKAGGSWSYRD